MAPLALHEPPLPVAPFPLTTIWHERRQREPAHRFLRELVVQTAEAI